MSTWRETVSAKLFLRLRRSRSAGRETPQVSLQNKRSFEDNHSSMVRMASVVKSSSKFLWPLSSSLQPRNTCR
ncbi:hypothetical protein EYF80_061932 [Liparis tanakae]|uniref:Uncharacterized protein n=1 Tax=Liparis tanakae TaxID=230148 RepID=A0A4Z2EGY3_9TELE|nr:hypothetical protein EYF80_061932 [Liparis tanakae]